MRNMVQTVRSFWPFFLLICALSGAGGFSMIAWIAAKPPLTLVGVREADGISVVNGALEIQLSIIRTLQCDAHVERWMWQNTERFDRRGKPIRRWVNLPSVANPPTELDVEVTYIISIPMPSNITPGNWFYWSRSYDNCPLVPALTPKPRESPDVPVLVVDQPKGPPGPALLLPEDGKPDHSITMERPT